MPDQARQEEQQRFVFASLTAYREVVVSPDLKLFGAVEAGGTKFVVGVGKGPDDVSTARIPTTTPAETIAHAIAWLRARGPLAAIGVASFGPVDLDEASPHFG